MRSSEYPNQLSWWWDERMLRLLPGNCFQSASVLLYVKLNFHCVCVCVFIHVNMHLCSVPQVKVLGNMPQWNNQRLESKSSLRTLSLSQATRF